MTSYHKLAAAIAALLLAIAVAASAGNRRAIACTCLEHFQAGNQISHIASSSLDRPDPTCPQSV